MHTRRLSSKYVIGLLLAAGAALVAAFMVAPAALLNGTGGVVRDHAALPATVGRGLVEYWRAGGPEFPPLLRDLSDYWFRWHAIKVVISSLLVLTFALLTVALWRRHRQGAGRHAIGAAGSSVFTALAAVVLIANIQATAVPVVALLPLLSDGAPGGELAQTLREMRTGLTGPVRSPALTVLVGEVERYNWVLVAAAAPVMLVAGLAAVLLWRRRAGDDARLRRGRRTLAVVAGLTATGLLVVIGASVFSALEPAGALRGLIDVG